jgi:hypothetical protein
MKRVLPITLFFISFFQTGYSQTTVMGIECVTPGVDYEYRFNAGWDSAVSIEVCVKGGVITGDGSKCKTGAGISSVTIRWDLDSKNGSIEISYPRGKMRKNVNISPELGGGQIDSTKKMQFIAFKKSPADLECSPAIGGGCNPTYNYQWQQSTNLLDWKDISGAQNKKLKFSSPLTEPLYFRRRVVEYNSGTIAYSDAVAVFVEPDMTGHK